MADDSHLRKFSRETDHTIFLTMNFSYVPVDDATRNELSALLVDLGNHHSHSDMYRFSKMHVLEADSLEHLRRSREFLAHVRSTLWAKNDAGELQMTVGSWADLYKQVPPSQIPSVYALVVLIHDIASDLGSRRPARITREMIMFDEQANRLARHWACSVDYKNLCRTLPHISKELFKESKPSDDVLRLTRSATEAANTILTDARHKRCDEILGVCYLNHSVRVVSNTMKADGTQLRCDLYNDMCEEDKAYISSVVNTKDMNLPYHVRVCKPSDSFAGIEYEPCDTVLIIDEFDGLFVTTVLEQEVAAALDKGSSVAKRSRAEESE